MRIKKGEPEYVFSRHIVRVGWLLSGLFGNGRFENTAPQAVWMAVLERFILNADYTNSQTIIPSSLAMSIRAVVCLLK